MNEFRPLGLKLNDAVSFRNNNFIYPGLFGMILSNFAN